MNFVALKMLVGDRMKYLALVAGISFAALLITQQASIFMGFALQTGTWIRETSVADLWVTDPQVEFSEDFKPMSAMMLQRVRGVAGVDWAVPMYKNYLRTRLPDGTLVQSRIVGLDDATLTGGPPVIVEGDITDLRRDRAVFVNVEQASDSLRLKRWGNRPLQIGDRISVNDNEAVVVGFYRAGREFFWDPVIYTTYSRALSWAPAERKQLGFILVRVDAGADVQQVAQRIRDATGHAVWTNDEFDRQSTNDILQKTGILVNFGITITLGFVIGMLVAGQTFYTFVLDNLRHFGALKAMGLSNGRVLWMLCLQVLLVALVGYGIGVGAAAIAGRALQTINLAFVMSWQIPIVGLVAVLICCFFAGVLGMIRVVRLEPAVVFKS
jgi:putative ABC transport system permease protein